MRGILKINTRLFCVKKTGAKSDNMTKGGKLYEH